MISQRDRSAGFTLIETLVALAVVAVVSVALQRGFVAARQTLARAESVFAGEAVARGILETRLGDLAPASGVMRGTTDGLTWMVTSEPLDLPLPPPPRPPSPASTRALVSGASSRDPVQPQAVWLPLRVTISIDVGSGPPLVVVTVHLARSS